mmetsp:Transcript_77800/g.117042  ORF Transcript_77800/g.117042 Transcript_77800/m.117042 type:complete len:88 (+) Transcript_77800:1740-2003(+)
MAYIQFVIIPFLTFFHFHGNFHLRVQLYGHYLQIQYRQTCGHANSDEHKYQLDLLHSFIELVYSALKLKQLSKILMNSFILFLLFFF